MYRKEFSIMENQFLEKHLTQCRLCPRECGANRIAGETGFCGAGTNVKVARAALHYWEEPCLSGTQGSGTVFFSHCTLKCVFCQNYEISTKQTGYAVSISHLSDIFLKLQQQGAHNINLVTPTHYVPQIIIAVKEARKKGLFLPIVYNSSGYESLETLELLKGIVDIYLPDFKYFNNEHAAKYSHVYNYHKHVVESISSMVKQTGKPQFDENGMLKRGVIIRHLMLPGLIDDTKNIISEIANRFSDEILFSLMNQYTPLAHVAPYPEINCKLDPLDYDDAVSYAVSKGIVHGFIQDEETASQSFIPNFDGEGII